MKYASLSLLVAMVLLAAMAAGLQRYPAAQTERAMEGMLELAGGPNRFHHERLADVGWRTIVRPSPDLMYSAMVYDLREGPLRFTFPAHAGYWSVQFIDPETSSFAQVGNSHGVTGPTTVLLSLGHAPSQAQEGNEHVITSAYERGVILLRYLVVSTADAPRLDALRRQVSLSKP